MKDPQLYSVADSLKTRNFRIDASTTIQLQSRKSNAFPGRRDTRKSAVIHVASISKRDDHEELNELGIVH